MDNMSQSVSNPYTIYGLPDWDFGIAVTPAGWILVTIAVTATWIKCEEVIGKK